MRKAVFICPGRGTYNKTELGTLQRTFPRPELLGEFDAIRSALGEPGPSELDAARRFTSAKHGRGDHASGLIYACSFGDFLNLATDIEVVAVTGNSMGWYTALACAGAVSPENGFSITTTMGGMMHEQGAGGQLLYPHVDDEWRLDPATKTKLLDLVAEIASRNDHFLSLSIDLGGTLVLAGNERGLEAFEAEVPKRDRFPMRLPGHAGFHSSLVGPASERALGHFSTDIFSQPEIPMIDGRGQIWWPNASGVSALWDYTFGHQVTETYDFTRAMAVAAREFAPDIFVIAGPRTTLGGSVAQSLIAAEWKGLRSKPEFQTLQSETLILISMGREDQRALATKGPTHET